MSAVNNLIKRFYLVYVTSSSMWACSSRARALRHCTPEIGSPRKPLQKFYSITALFGNWPSANSILKSLYFEKKVITPCGRALWLIYCEAAVSRLALAPMYFNLGSVGVLNWYGDKVMLETVLISLGSRPPSGWGKELILRVKNIIASHFLCWKGKPLSPLH